MKRFKDEINKYISHIEDVVLRGCQLSPQIDVVFHTMGSQNSDTCVLELRDAFNLKCLRKSMKEQRAKTRPSKAQTWRESSPINCLRRPPVAD